MERDLVLNGIHVGEHRFVPEEILEELRVRVVEPGFRFVSIRPRGPAFDQAFFLQWGRYLAENRVYFAFLYMVQHAPQGRESRFDPETVTRLRGGPFFLHRKRKHPLRQPLCHGSEVRL